MSKSTKWFYAVVYGQTTAYGTLAYAKFDPEGKRLVMKQTPEIGAFVTDLLTKLQRKKVKGMTYDKASKEVAYLKSEKQKEIDGHFPYSPGIHDIQIICYKAK